MVITVDDLAQAGPGRTGRLDSAEALAAQLAALVGIDPRLEAVVGRAGPFAVRTADPGFAGLAQIICGQQLSTASAGAIWARFAVLEGALDPARYLGLSEEAVRATGFSRGKYLTLRGVAEAVAEGRLDFATLADRPAEAAIAELCRLKGVGPWTAEIYLMVSAAHPDIFPAGDLALQVGVQWAFGLDARPAIKDLREMAGAWSPYRSTAALLFWRYYRAVRNREGLLL
ncbi:DNA-3-methyladenine glycosylase [Devosia sp.]|uniref:DNA-3-methyladenine glycosylase family protein n=1 Tax=Devosia sp. TaxID=1871048 RepID=UPI0035AF9D58